MPEKTNITCKGNVPRTAPSMKDLKFNELAPKIKPIEEPGKRGFIWAMNEDFQP